MQNILSLSGGRSSAYLLDLLVKSNTQIDKIVFANTGKERKETLDFVNKLEQFYSVKIHWLEYKKDSFTETNYTLASRKGEPFDQLIRDRKYLPNGRLRLCTQYLKIETIQNFLRSENIVDYCEYIGLRADEENRVLKAKNNSNNKDRILRFPLYYCGVTKEQVIEFWKSMPFDLKLEPHESNCDLCFLKGTKIKQNIVEKQPELITWWIEQEEKFGKTFSKIPYKHLKIVTDNQTTSLPCNCTD